MTGNKGKYFRVVGIHSDGRINREISLVCYLFQNPAGTIDQTLFETSIGLSAHAPAIGPKYGDLKWPGD